MSAHHTVAAMNAVMELMSTSADTGLNREEEEQHLQQCSDDFQSGCRQGRKLQHKEAVEAILGFHGVPLEHRQKLARVLEMNWVGKT